MKKRMPRRWLSLLLIVLVLAQTGCGGGNGDRVLVAKYMYDANFGPPQRHDVVVFRYPDEPLKGGVPTNYIKRLLGLAGETIAIFLGQLFVTTALSHSEDREKVDPLELWRDKYMHSNDPAAIDLFKEGKFEIIRKSPSVMLALRRMVYDNDFQAKDLKGVLPPRWNVKDTAWTTADDKTFTLDGSRKDAVWLHYQHIERPANWPEKESPNYKAKVSEIAQREHKPQLIRDFLSYNVRSMSPASGPRPMQWIGEPNHWVGDLMLEAELKVDKAEGEFLMELARGVDRFQAKWDLATGDCTLYRLSDVKGGKEELGTRPTAVKGTGTYQIRFANFDERLTVWVNQNLPFGDGMTYPRPWHWDAAARQWINVGPTTNDLKPASIGGAGAAVTVNHLKLWRDTYYLTDVSGTDFADAPREDGWGDPDQWSGLHSPALRTLYVQPGHFLALGDNSPESSDSRHWGVVPERLLLGRALVVYYPFNRVGVIH